MLNENVRLVKNKIVSFVPQSIKTSNGHEVGHLCPPVGQKHQHQQQQQHQQEPQHSSISRWAFHIRPMESLVEKHRTNFSTFPVCNHNTQIIGRINTQGS